MVCLLDSLAVILYALYKTYLHCSLPIQHPVLLHDDSLQHKVFPLNRIYRQNCESPKPSDYASANLTTRKTEGLQFKRKKV